MSDSDSEGAVIAKGIAALVMLVLMVGIICIQYISEFTINSGQHYSVDVSEGTTYRLLFECNGDKRNLLVRLSDVEHYSKKDHFTLTVGESAHYIEMSGLFDHPAISSPLCGQSKEWGIIWDSDDTKNQITMRVNPDFKLKKAEYKDLENALYGFDLYPVDIPDYFLGCISLAFMAMAYKNKFPKKFRIAVLSLSGLCAIGLFVLILLRHML